MNGASISKSTDIIPESFYDILTYIAPSFYLLIGAGYSCGIHLSRINKVIDLNESWVYHLFIFILLLGVLYLVGQILTSISYYVIRKPIDSMLQIVPRIGIFGKYKESRSDDIEENLFKIRRTDANLSLEMVKRYARVMSGRNLSLVSLILILMNLFLCHTPNIILFSVVFALTLFDYSFRHICLHIILRKTLRICGIDTNDVVSQS